MYIDQDIEWLGVPACCKVKKKKKMIRCERKSARGLPRSGDTNDRAPSIRKKKKNELRRIM